MLPEAVWARISSAALFHFDRQHLYASPETLLILNSVELSHSETMLSSNLVFFERWQTLLPCFWPPFDNSKVIMGGISDRHIKIISHSPDPWLKGQGHLQPYPHGNLREKRGAFLMIKFEGVINSTSACSYLFIFMCPTHKHSQFSLFSPQLWG